MEWQDQGVLLTVRRHGEGAAIIEVFTEHHGLHAGLVRGGASRKSAPILQPGAQLALTWRARLEDQLGSYTVEPIFSRNAAILSDRRKLYAFNALAAMLASYLPEREPNNVLFDSCMDLLMRLHSNENWPHRYCLFEQEFLESLGYGIDLRRCAVTGAGVDLAYVSPKSGRAVSREAAKGWESRLLEFPEFLRKDELVDISDADFRRALALSGYFFESRIPTARPGLPEPRQRLAELLAR